MNKYICRSKTVIIRTHALEKIGGNDEFGKGNTFASNLHILLVIPTKNYILK